MDVYSRRFSSILHSMTRLHNMTRDNVPLQGHITDRAHRHEDTNIDPLIFATDPCDTDTDTNNMTQTRTTLKQHDTDTNNRDTVLSPALWQGQHLLYTFEESSANIPSGYGRRVSPLQRWTGNHKLQARAPPQEQAMTQTPHDTDTTWHRHHMT